MLPEIEGLGELSEIGRGGFGVVYRAEDAAHGRTVAVKVLRHSLEESAQARFERECRAAGSLSGHPNIVSIHGSGTTEDGDPYLVMDHLPGGSLADRVRSDGPLDAAAAIELGIALCGALAAAHARGIIHRDVKPENVLFSAFGLPQLVDFGIARMASEFETRSGAISASLLYAPAEVIAGDPPSASGDVYSLASLLHFALSGSPPFERTEEEALAALIARITSAPPPDLRLVGVPDELATVVERGLAKDPTLRPLGAEAFGEELRAAGTALGQRPSAIPTGPPIGAGVLPGPDPDATRDVAALTPPASGPDPVAPVPVASATRRRPLWLLVAAAVAVLAVVAVAVWANRGSERVGAGPGSTTTAASGAFRVTEPTSVSGGLRVARRYAIGTEGDIGSSVVLSNATTKTIKRVWAEVVPKELAARVADVSFSSKPTGVILKDPIVYWVVTLGPRAERRIGWTTPLPAQIEASQKYLDRVVRLHRSAVEDAADIIRFASAEVERDTGAKGVDPTSTVGDTGDPVGGSGDEGGTTQTTSDGGAGDSGDDGGGTTSPVDTTVVIAPTTTRMPTTTVAPLARPGAPSGVVVRSPSMVDGSNPAPGGYAVRVQLSWNAPSSGGPPATYRIRHQEFWYPGCGSSRSSGAVIDAGTTSGRSASLTVQTTNGCSWIVWSVAASNASGSSSYTAAAGVIPATKGVGWAYHLVRAVGGKAVHGDDQDCGVALYLACGTSPSAGATINPGTAVSIYEQAGG